MSRAPELRVNQNLHRKAPASSTGEEGAPREGGMAGGTNDPRNPEKRAGEDRRRKEARPIASWPPPPVHPGPVRPEARGLPAAHQRARTHRRTHTRALLHTWIWLPLGKETAGEARGVGKAPGAAAGRAPPSPPPARARTPQHTRGSAGLLQLREPPTPTAPRSGVVRRWLGPQLGREGQVAEVGSCLAPAKGDVGVLLEKGLVKGNSTKNALARAGAREQPGGALHPTGKHCTCVPWARAEVCTADPGLP